VAEPLSKTAYVILGMLQLGKHTGYEIKSLVDVSTRFFWAASYGQIYPEFARLEQAGLIRAEPVVADSRGRKAYHLTDAGEAALRDWLLSDALPSEERIEPVRQMRAAHEQVLQQLEGIASDKDADGTDPGAPRLCLEWGIAYQEFMIDWCSKMERRLAVEEPAGKGI
jgi:DNA-binding PadR family transcriptional regulator